MIKNILVLFAALLFFQNAKAQKKTDTLLYYMKNSGEIVANSDSADYFLFILPADSATKLYPVNEYYPNGKPKLISSSIKRSRWPVLQGPCINFFPNGRKKSITNYNEGYTIGDETDYYPNGQLYALKKYDQQSQCLLVECHDSTGKVLTENGNGKWLKFDEIVKNEIEEGPVKDSLEEGEWHEMVNDSAKYEVVYHKGIVISSTDAKRQIGDIYSAVQIEPEFKTGIAGFYEFLRVHINYPASAKEDNIQGKVVLSFVVEKDGSLTNMVIVRAPDQSLADEAIRVMKLSPKWSPGMQDGLPVRVQYTVPISFNLGDDR